MHKLCKNSLTIKILCKCVLVIQAQKVETDTAIEMVNQCVL